MMLQRLVMERSCILRAAGNIGVRARGKLQGNYGSTAPSTTHKAPYTLHALPARADGREVDGEDDDRYLAEVMQAVQDGIVTPDEGVQLLHAHSHREKEAIDISPLMDQMNSFPEIVLGSGKTPEQIADGMASLASKQRTVIAVRIQPSVYAAVRKLLPGVEYHAGGQILTLRTSENGTGPVQSRLPGSIAILTGGMEDMVVAEECRLVAEHLGCYCFKVANVKTSDLRTIIQSASAIQSAAIVIVVSEGDVALPSIIAGIVDAPVLSIPSRSGFASALGHTSLMMTSVKQGVTYVGMDDGVAAAVSSARILMSVNKINDMIHSSPKQQPQQQLNEVDSISNYMEAANGSDTALTSGSTISDGGSSVVESQGYTEIQEALEAINNACHLPSALNGAPSMKGSEGGH